MNIYAEATENKKQEAFKNLEGKIKIGLYSIIYGQAIPSVIGQKSVALTIMAISYNGLWKLLIDNNMNKGDLCKKTGLSSSTMANDSPALSAADVGIAISDGAQIAREVADITIEADNLFELVALRKISTNLMGRIHKNYVRIVGINSGLIILGLSGVVQPTTSALLHNTSTIAISMKGMSGWKTGVTIRDGKENGHA